MKKTAILLLAALCSLSAGAVTFNPDTLYSRWVINSCLYHFQANTRPAGFARFDAEGNMLAASESNRGFDYVPGLVAKAVLEAVDYYQNQSYVCPWYYAIRHYGLTYAAGPTPEGMKGVPAEGGSLDDLNATKLYFELRDLSQPGAAFADASAVEACGTALTRAQQALGDHNDRYSISAATSMAYLGSNDLTGGWWHKRNYENEMWCDGQYMGPALLAQMLPYGYPLPGKTADECWDIISSQLRMSWGRLWNPQTQLLYHAFSAVPAQDAFWADQQQGAHYGVSAEYWGRATGWYFLALVDILAEMPQDNPHRAELQGYLNQLAAGIAERQDSATGCWRQLLQYGQTVFAEGDNYLESSCSAIFIAAYLKGMRLGLYDTDYYPLAERAYRGFVENFIQDGEGAERDGNDIVLTHNCASAGLSDIRKGDAAYYLCQTCDTRRTDDYTEGKVLGAFILAATEYERAAAAGKFNPASGLTTANQKHTCRCKTMRNGQLRIRTRKGEYDACGRKLK